MAVIVQRVKVRETRLRAQSALPSQSDAAGTRRGLPSFQTIGAIAAQTALPHLFAFATYQGDHSLACEEGVLTSRPMGC